MRGGLRRSQNERLLQDLRADPPSTTNASVDSILYDGHGEESIGYFPNPVFTSLGDESLIFYSTFLVYFERERV
jgi:hypothetical protein